MSPLAIDPIIEMKEIVGADSRTLIIPDLNRPLNP